MLDLIHLRSATLWVTVTVIVIILPLSSTNPPLIQNRGYVKIFIVISWFGRL